MNSLSLLAGYAMKYDDVDNLDIPRCGVFLCLACVASVSVWFQSKERPRKGIFDFQRARAFLPHPLPVFHLRHFSRGL